MTDQVESLRVAYESDVAAKATADAAALNQLGNSAETVETKITRTTASFAKVNKSLDDGALLAAKSATANKKYEDSVAAITAELERGLISQAKADDLSAKAAAKREQDMQAARRSAQALADSYGLTGTTAEKAASSVSTVGGALQRSRADQEAMEKATRGGQMALRDLAMQSQDFVVQITSGQGLFRPLLQQGSQVYQQLQASGQGFGALRSAASIALAAITSPMGLLVTAGAAAAGAIALLVSNSESAARRLNDLSVQLRATKSDYEALAAAGDAAARNAARTSTVSVADARTSYQTIAAVPNYHGSIDDITNLIKLSGDLARTFGTTVPDSAARLASALANPTAAAKELAEKGLLGIDGASARVIERMQNQGDIVGAQSAIIAAYSSKLKGVQTETLTPIQKALEDLSHAFLGTGDSGKDFGSSLAGILRDQIALTIRDLAEFLRSLNAVIDAAMKIKGAFGKPLVDADTGKTPNASAQLQALDNGAVSKLIYDIAEKNQIPANIADLGTRVAYQESKGRQFNADGSVYTSSAGAMGIGQLMPGTAKDMGVDATTAEGNVLGMLRYLLQLSKNSQFPTEALQAGAYNAGPGGMAEYLAGNKVLKKETVDYVKAVAGEDIPNSRARASDSITGGGSHDPMSTLPDSVKSILLEPDTTFAKTEQDAWDRVQRLIHAQADLKAAGVTSGDAYDSLNARLAKASGEYSSLGTAVDLSNRAVTDQLAPLSAASGAARTLAEAQNALTLAARASGEDVTAEQRATRNAAVQAQLSAAFRDTVVAIDQATAAQAKINDSYDNGARSVVEATNRTRAETDARKTSIEGTALYASQVDTLTAAYNRQSAVQAEAQIRAKSFDQKDQLEQIKLETQLVGAEADVRDRELALLKERQALIKAGGPESVNTTSGQADLARVAQISDATAALQRQKQTMDELANIGTQAFDRIGTAITQAFATGSLKALDFGGLVKGVMSEIVQSVLKMAVLNPILNELFGGTHRTTIGDVGGVLGGLLGNTGSTEVTGSSTGSSGILGLAAGLLGGSSGGSGGSSGAGSAAGASPFDSPLSAVGTLGSGYTLVSGAADVAGGSAGLGGGLISGLAEKITDSVVNALVPTSAVNLAAEAGDLSTSGLAAATLADAVGGTTETVAAISSAAGTVASALPYIGAAISVVTSLISGDYKSAAFTLAGAAIGTAILPGVGTAIGAAIGSLVTTFLPAHPLHPFENTELNVQGGQLVAGKTDGQLYDLDASKQGVEDYAKSINAYLASVKVVITNPDMNLGGIGQGITGMTQSLDPNTFFKRLGFANDSSDTSNFGVAKGALSGMSFDKPMDLQDELYKIAGFADALDALGIHLASVGKDISAIQIASVDGTNPGATSTVTDSSGMQITYLSDIRTALNADLASKTFADTTALDTEMQKVSDFLTSSLPGLLTPQKSVKSDLQDQIQTLNQKYADAEAQSRSYGLDNDTALHDANVRAVQIMVKPQVDAVLATMAGINTRYATATVGTVGAGPAANDNLTATQQAERTSLDTQWRQVWGDTIVTNEAYISSMNRLIDTQNAEIAVAEQQAKLSRETTVANLAASSLDYAKRAGSGGVEFYAEMSFDTKAQVERDTFIKSWTDAYGMAVTNTQQFQDQLSLVDAAHYKERLALQAQYVQTSLGAQTVTDRNAAGQIITSLTSYARGLQTSDSSPLSSQAQYELASRQFSAVAGKAQSGDYTSTQQLQASAEALLSTSKAYNGSSAGFSSDYDRVLEALNNVAAVNPDTLTASYQASIVQQQTDQLLEELRLLRSEVSAQRLEIRQAALQPRAA